MPMDVLHVPCVHELLLFYSEDLSDMSWLTAVLVVYSQAVIPAFDPNWLVVGLHREGVPGRLQVLPSRLSTPAAVRSARSSHV